MNNQHTTQFYTQALAGVAKRIAELEILVATKPAAGNYYSNQLAKAQEVKSQYEGKLS